MIKTIRPFEAIYKRTKFRTEHSARWAVLYDLLGIRWKYWSDPIKLPPYVFDKQHFLAEHRNEDKIYFNKKLDQLAEHLEMEAKRRTEFMPDFWFPDFEAWGKVKKNYMFKEMFVDDYEKMMRFINHKHQQIFLCMDFNMPVKSICSKGLVGYITAKDIMLARTYEEWQSAVKQAMEFRIGGYDLPKYRV